MFKTTERAGAQNRLSLSLREPEEVYNYLESLRIYRCLRMCNCALRGSRSLDVNVTSFEGFSRVGGGADSSSDSSVRRSGRVCILDVYAQWGVSCEYLQNWVPWLCIGATFLRSSA